MFLEYYDIIQILRDILEEFRESEKESERTEALEWAIAILLDLDKE